MGGVLEIEIDGCLPGFDENSKTLNDKVFNKVIKNLLKNPDKILDSEERWGGFYILRYLQLRNLDPLSDKKMVERIDQELALNPDCSLMRILKFDSDMERGKVEKMISFHDIFGDVKAISQFEMMEYLRTNTSYALLVKDINFIEAVYTLLHHIVLPKYLYSTIFAETIGARLKILHDFLHNMNKY